MRGGAFECETDDFDTDTDVTEVSLKKCVKLMKPWHGSVLQYLIIGKKVVLVVRRAKTTTTNYASALQ